ncbi:Ppx/GppA phosphatase family-domain-containing protein [Radiomyces spectabilis]|uniref:Ppx/GppA phosphatase family-domain-containing protein n=1 Tax=Radiomyces spectabilis TaxID=64574 RepID=UPI002220280E|nr:Ppx/GppA phosphatase family-domain-containing protein [Radiomyces spectabilis]KAI8366034.1 Ppx/GppA phosphatase family-domain-containing protein [Radiomyces spectabilis]
MVTATTEAPFGIVDMGSNGIRFGIVSALARHLPVAFEERAPISLLDSQGDERIVPSDTMDQVISSFLRFRSLCQDSGVNLANVRVIATEATRVAANSAEFLQRIYDATGWTVSLLTKEEEALISASGIVGSFYKVNGLTMDLGGGSVELSYVTTVTEGEGENAAQAGNIRVAKEPVSLPYGAAALKRKLALCRTSEERQALYDEIVEQISDAAVRTQPPSHLLYEDGYDLYMSGGGFRALGYLSMALKGQDDLLPPKQMNHKLTYPIPIINGYSIQGKKLYKLAEFYRDKDPEDMMRQLRVFRISKRRASMIPASCFLVSAIMKVLKIRRVFFSEGGVRQGFCFQLLSAEEQAKDPLLEGVKAYASLSPFALSHDEYEAIYRILVDALPDPYLDTRHPLQLHRLLPAVIHLSNLTSHYPKETRAFVAFHMPLPGGPLANIPGLSHYERAVIALLLAYRQGGTVPDPVFYTIQGMVGRKGIAVCKYLGRLMELVFAVSPIRPGVGLIKSGLRFTTLTGPSSWANEPNDDTDDNCSPDLLEEDEQYPTMQLQIHLPKAECPLIEAPAVMSVIESLDKKINTRKFDMDEERRALNCPTLFSVDIIRQ